MRPRARRLALVVAMVVAATAGYVLWRAAGAADEIVHPPREALVRSPAEFGLPFEDVSFETSDGVMLRGWYVPPSLDVRPRASRTAGNIYLDAKIIVEPGHAQTRDKVITQTAMLAQSGFGVLSFDWRAVGESGGETSTVGRDEVRDVEAAVAWLRSRDGMSPAIIGALGQSAGSAAIITAAADDPTIAAVVAETPLAALSEMIATGVEQQTGLPAFPFAPLVVLFGELESGARISEVRPVDDIGRIAPRPVLIIRAGRDLWVPSFHAERLMAAAGEPKELWDAPESAHSDVVNAYPEEYERRVVGFFDRALLP